MCLFVRARASASATDLCSRSCVCARARACVRACVCSYKELCWSSQGAHPRYQVRIDPLNANVPKAMQAADYMHSDAKHREGQTVVQEKEGNRRHARQLRLA